MNHEFAGVLVQAASDTYQYNSPWWIYVVAGLAFFGLAVNLLVGFQFLLRLLGLFVVVKRPGRRTKSLPDKESLGEPLKVVKAKKEKKDPLDSLR